MKTVETIQNNMAHAIGTTKYIWHWTKALVFTDGVEQLREDADCHWLVDAIASYQGKKLKNIPFQVWKLKVCDDKSAILTMVEDSGEPNIITQKIPFTDFPLEDITLWVNDGCVGDSACKVLMLPSEY